MSDLENPAGRERESAERALAEWWARNWGRPVDLGLLADILPVLLRAEFGRWSRADMEQLMAIVGRPATIDSGDLVAQAAGARLVAIKAASAEERFGFGEFRSLGMTFTCPGEQQDPMFIGALGDCVRLLGVPDLVGGPDAQAIWRRDGRTLILCRRSEPSAVQLTIEPTAARDAADRAVWSRGTWKPSCRWLAWPEEDRRYDVGVIGFKEPTTSGLAQFESDLDALFDSLNRDLPLLYPHATYVIWQLSIPERPDWLVQGWFCAYAQHRVEIQEGGELRARMYPHGPSSAREIAVATKAAVRAGGVVHPGRQLRFRAWLSPTTQALQAFRLGLEWDEQDPTADGADQQPDDAGPPSAGRTGSSAQNPLLLPADYDGAVRIATLAAGFDWTWYIDKDLQRFCDAAGWSITGSNEYRDDLRTDLSIQSRSATVGFMKRMFDDIWLPVTDRLDESLPWEQRRKALADTFVVFGDRLIEALGPPTGREPGETGTLLWDRYRVWIRLEVGSGDIRLHIVSWEWQAAADAEAKYDAGDW
ncbi:MAG: hypothetical protein JWN03_5228 [Nocardia sp.]|uniref:DUF6301 family protein n=1 Tax=Nocardia sp. TaxID=1821 RepID=UPI002632099C|nr:DUF6301 family protein [Nocardia sp.]MCU1644953.1 hypothetical protein [Nocardia sp.]